MFIKVDLDGGLSEGFIICARTVLGALVLVPLGLRAGALPMLLERKGWTVALALAQVIVPFGLITFGENHVPSALAGILVAGTIVFVKSSNETTRPDVRVVVNPDGTVSCMGDAFGAGGTLPPNQTPEEFCASLSPHFDTDKRFHLTSLREAWLGLGAQLIVIAWLLGATFVGAEWHLGSMTTLLTWEPRRTRVFLAKLIACVVLIYVGAVALEVLLGAALLPAALVRGTTAGADAEWLRESLGVLGRVGLACSVGGALGFGLAMVGRNTAASIGVGFGYLIVVENLVRGLRPQWAPWLLGDNTAAFVGGPGEQVFTYGRTTLESGLTIGAYAAVALLAGWIFFRRRDVT
jgi:ABC-type transport system involved in multi-copper enzyme maturation permease subunit